MTFSAAHRGNGVAAGRELLNSLVNVVCGEKGGRINIVVPVAVCCWIDQAPVTKRRQVSMPTNINIVGALVHPPHHTAQSTATPH